MNEKKHGDEFPLLVERNSGRVTIHRVQKPNGYTYYQLRYYQSGKRQTKSCTNLQDAQKEAAIIANRLHKVGSDSLVLRGEECVAYRAATKTLSSTGIAIDVVARDYAHCLGLLGGKASMVEAVRQYLAAHHEPVEPKTTPEILKELLVVKKKEGISDVHYKDLEGRLGRFADRFSARLAEVTSTQIHDFLLSLNVEGRTRNNFRTCISNLVNFARQRRYVPREYNPLTEVPVAKEIKKPVELFTVDEMTTLLNHAKPEIIPFLCLVAFGGLRHEEAAKLDWSDWSNGHIRIRAEIAKCRYPRLVEVQPNLAAWLAPHRKERGRVQPFANMTNELADLAKTAELEWKHNGLRHSFGSFRLAIIKDPAKVAYEMGNSERMVFQHYRELVTEAEAQRWFAIMPK